LSSPQVLSLDELTLEAVLNSSQYKRELMSVGLIN